MSKQERIILAILSILNFTHILDFMIMMPLGPYLRPYFGINPFEFSILVAAYTISAAVSGFVAAFFVNNFDRKQVLLFAYGLFLIGTLGCGIAPSYELLLIARIFAGVFGGLIGAQVTSIVSDTFEYERRGVAMGAVTAAFALASTFGVPFALFLANMYGWHAPFWAIVGLGVFVFLGIYFYLPKMNTHLNNNASQHNRLEVIQDVIRHPLQYKALIFTFLMMFGHFLVIPFINPFMQSNVGFSKEFTPNIYLVGGASAFLAAPILGKLADKFGKLNIFSFCVVSALPMIWVLTNMPKGTNWIAALALFAVWFVVSTGRGIAGGAMVSNVVSAEHRGSFQSFNSAFQQLGTGIASLMAGTIITQTDDNMIHNYPIVGYLSIVALVVCMFLGRDIFAESEIKVK